MHPQVPSGNRRAATTTTLPIAGTVTAAAATAWRALISVPSVLAHPICRPPALLGRRPLGRRPCAWAPPARTRSPRLRSCACRACAAASAGGPSTRTSPFPWPAGRPSLWWGPAAWASRCSCASWPVLVRLGKAPSCALHTHTRAQSPPLPPDVEGDFAKAISPLRKPPCLAPSTPVPPACLADPFDSGSITLAGKAPEEWGVPKYRSLVSYVHQVCRTAPLLPRRHARLLPCIR